MRWCTTTLGFREEYRYEIPGGVQVFADPGGILIELYEPVSAHEHRTAE